MEGTENVKWMKTAKSNETVFAFTEEKIELGPVSVNDLISNAVAVTVRKYHKHTFPFNFHHVFEVSALQARLTREHTMKWYSTLLRFVFPL